MDSGYRKALVGILFAWSVLGVTIIYRNATVTGLHEVIASVKKGKHKAGIGAAPRPFKHQYTYIEPVDEGLAAMVGFFASLINGDVPAEGTLFIIWALAQFVTAWSTILLEGLRMGNRRLAIAWTGILGLFAIFFGWSASLPLWLALHILKSPVARLQPVDGPAARRALFVNRWDSAVIPASISLTWIAIAVLLSLPGRLGKLPIIHYNLLALFVTASVWNSLVQTGLRKLCEAVLGSGEPTELDGQENKKSHNFTTTAQTQLKAMVWVYRCALLLLVVTHLPLFVISLVPESYRWEMLEQVSRKRRGLVFYSTFQWIFVPYGQDILPKVNHFAYNSRDLAIVSVNFLQWDILLGAVPLILWALFLQQRTSTEARGLGTLIIAICRIFLWTVLGGPYAAVVALLWVRDQQVLSGGDMSRDKTEKKEK